MKKVGKLVAVSIVPLLTSVRAWRKTLTFCSGNLLHMFRKFGQEILQEQHRGTIALPCPLIFWNTKFLKFKTFRQNFRLAGIKWIMNILVSLKIKKVGNYFCHLHTELKGFLRTERRLLNTIILTLSAFDDYPQKDQRVCIACFF